MINIAVFPIHEAKRIKHIFKEKFPIDIRHDDKTCTRGCSVTVEMWVEEEHAPEFMAFIQTEEKAMLDDVDWQAADGEIDMDADSAICPACTSEFNPKTGECSTCGLKFF